MSFADGRKQDYAGLYAPLWFLGVALVLIAGIASLFPIYETTSGVETKVHVEKLEDRITVKIDGTTVTSYFISDYTMEKPVLCYTDRETGFRVSHRYWRICNGN
jgi:hypothetical protein